MNTIEVIYLVSAIIGIVSFAWFLYDKRSPFKKISWKTAEKSAQMIADKVIADNYSPTLIFGIGRGGAILGALISGCLGHRPLLVIDRTYSWSKKGRVDDTLLSINIPEDYLENVLLVAGEAHSGSTMNRYYDHIKHIGGKNIRRAVLLLEEGCLASVEYYVVKSDKKNLLLPWMFTKKYRRDDRTPPSLPDSNTRQFVIRLYLLRHGESSAKEDIFVGSSDFDLTVKGVEQSVEAGRYFLTKRVCQVYSSPLGRAVKTARIIQGFIPGAELSIRESLKEIHFGAWEGLRRSDIKKRFASTYRKWIVNPVITVPNEAENPDEVLDRMTTFLHEIQKAYASQNNTEIIAVSHKSAMRVLLCHIEGKPLSDYRKIEVKNVKPFTLLFDGKQWLREN